MAPNKLEIMIQNIEQKQHELTVMKGACGSSIGISVDVHPNFLEQKAYFKLPYEFIDGKTSNASILLPQGNISEFLRIFLEYVKEYAKEYNLHPTMAIIKSDFNMFTDQEEPVTYLEVKDGRPHKKQRLF